MYKGDGEETHLSCNGFNPVQPHQTDVDLNAHRPSRHSGPRQGTARYHTHEPHCGSCLWSEHLCQVGHVAELALLWLY